jgi:DNA invertase Pin-like site-specific DNA recombinase
MREPFFRFEAAAVTRRFGMTDADRTVCRCLPLAEWPEPDRAAWAAAHHRGGLLDDDGLAASWAPATNAIIAGGYGRYLSFLAETEGLDRTVRPGDRVTRPRIEAYIARLRECNHSSTVAARILQLSRAVAVTAPGVDWTWLRRIAARLRRMSQPARDDRVRLVPATTVRDLGAELMQRAEAGGGLSTRQRALLFRDGLMIRILLACSVRARNVAAMSIGTSVQRRGDEWWVALSPDETKNGRPFEVPLPASFTASIERYCPVPAAIGALGWQYRHAYIDRAISGASALRPAYQSLLEDARRGQFDVVVSEALDRLSRDQEDVAGLFKRLRFAGVRLFTLAEGEITEPHVGLKGTMNALFLKDLADKTRRGLEGRVREGRSDGGLCFRYDVVREHDARGDPIHGGRKVNDAEAAIVQRIFAEFAAGKSPRQIAIQLNRDDIPVPRGGDWDASTINGMLHAAPASLTTRSMSAGWSGTGCATSRTRQPESGSPA